MSEEKMPLSTRFVLGMPTPELDYDESRYEVLIQKINDDEDMISNEEAKFLLEVHRKRNVRKSLASYL
jgi:hypothetical protein